jgi:hypothetical protein
VALVVHSKYNFRIKDSLHCVEIYKVLRSGEYCADWQKILCSMAEKSAIEQKKSGSEYRIIQSSKLYYFQ